VIVTQPVAGNSPFTVNKAKFLPAPRVGIAWSPFASKKTVIRAGAGLYYALLDNLSYRLDQNGPYNTVFAVKNIAFSSIAPDAVYTGAKVIPSGVQQDLRTPTVESWTLKIEQQLSPNTALASVTSDRMVTTNCFPLMRTCQLRRFARLRRAQRAIQLERFTIHQARHRPTMPCGIPRTGSPKASVRIMVLSWT